MNPVVVVGGGLAGPAAALALAGDGRSVVVLERTTGPHDKMCGEFLSVEAGEGLAALGVDIKGLGAVPIARVRLQRGTRCVEAPLPFTAHGIRRRTLDEALLERAASRGVAVQRGIRVLAVDGTAVTTDQGSLDASSVLLATGKHDLHARRRTPVGWEPLSLNIGFKMYFRASATLRTALDGVVTIVVYDGGYAGLQLVDGGMANLCLLVTPARYQAVGGRWDALLRWLVGQPGLAMLADAEPLLDRPLTISGVPYGYLASPDPGEAVFLLGDQAAVIPSFCGDGMAIAVHSGRLAAEAAGAGAPAHRYQAMLRRDVARQVRLASRLQRLTQTGWGQFGLMLGAGAVPGLLPLAARLTRVSRAA